MKAVHVVAMLCAIALPFTAANAGKQSNPQLQAFDDALPGDLVNDPTRLDWPVTGSGFKIKSIKGDSIPGGGAAMQLIVANKQADAWRIQAGIPLTAPIKSGTDYVVAFYARSEGADTPDGQGRIGVRIQQNSAPYSGFADTTLNIGTGWKLYEVTGRAPLDISRDNVSVTLQFAGAKQTLEIGQVIVVSGTTSILQAMAAKQPEPEIELPPAIAQKGKLLNDVSDRNWGFYGASLTQRATTTNVFGRVGTLISIAAAGATPYESGAGIPIRDGIDEGDVLIVGILARTLSAKTPDGQGIVTMRLQQNAAPYDGFMNAQVKVGPTWRLYQMKTRATRSFKPGEAALALQLAGAEQQIEIAQAYVVREQLTVNTTPPVAPAPSVQ